MDNTELELLCNDIVQNWLEKSKGIASYAGQRVRFTELLRFAIIETLRLQFNYESFPHQNPNGVSINGGESMIFVDTMCTPFTYPNCEKNLTFGETNPYVELNRVLRNINQQFQKDQDNVQFIFSVFPTTHNDRNWLNIFKIEESALFEKVSWIDFRFENNVPGILYYGEIQKKDIPSSYLEFVDETLEDTETDKKRIHIKFKERNTYNKILSQIKEDMENGKIGNPIKVSILQNIFEEKIIEKLISEYVDPAKGEKYFKQLYRQQLNAAKKSQILLSIINDSNRLSLRKEIQPNSVYNLFVYDDENFEKIKFTERRIKAFNLNDKSIGDSLIYLSKKRKPITVNNLKAY